MCRDLQPPPPWGLFKDDKYRLPNDILKWGPTKKVRKDVTAAQNRGGKESLMNPECSPSVESLILCALRSACLQFLMCSFVLVTGTLDEILPPVQRWLNIAALVNEANNRPRKKAVLVTLQGVRLVMPSQGSQSQSQSNRGFEACKAAVRLSYVLRWTSPQCEQGSLPLKQTLRFVRESAIEQMCRKRV